MSKNVILLDKDGNQLAPATTATQAKYSAGVTVKDKIDELNTRIDNLPSGGGTIESLSVTSNGTYTASGDVDGYSPVVVNVPPTLPEEQLVSEYNATYDTDNSKPYYYDKVRDANQPSNHYGNMQISNNQFEIISTSGNCKTGNQFFVGDMQKVVIQFGTFTNASAPTNTNNCLFTFCDRNSRGMLNYQPNGGSPRYWLKDVTGGNVYILEGTATGYDFEDKTIIYVWGGVLRNGHVYRSLNGVSYATRWGLYEEDGTPIIENIELGADRNDYYPIIQMGGGSAYVGATIKSVKVYKINDRYNTNFTE